MVHVDDLRVRRRPRDVVAAAVLGWAVRDDDRHVAAGPLVVLDGLNEGGVDGLDVEVVQRLLRAVERITHPPCMCVGA